MTADLQATWDQETAAQTRKTLRRLAGKVRAAMQTEAERKQAHREARKVSQKLHEQLTATIEDNAPDDLAYVESLAGYARQAESAKEAEDEARKAWVASVFARRKAQDELRVAVRRQCEPLPLFDRPLESQGTNGNGKPRMPVEPPPVKATSEPEPAVAPACKHCSKPTWCKDGVCDSCYHDPALYPFHIRYKTAAGPFHVKDRCGFGPIVATFPTLTEAEKDADARNAAYQKAEVIEKDMEKALSDASDADAQEQGLDSPTETKQPAKPKRRKRS